MTTILEQAINGVEGMRYMTSTSGNDGSSSINITFELTRPLDLAAVDVQNRVQGVTGRLPDAVKNTGVTINKVSTSFVLAAGFYSENNRYNEGFISNYIDIYVKDAIKRIPGVADAQIFGERKYSMRLWLDPSRLAARGLTASDVVDALQQQNVQIASGQVGAEPTATTQMYQISVRALGGLTEVAQFDNIVLKPGSNGALVRLADVGHAELGAEDTAASFVITATTASASASASCPQPTLWTWTKLFAPNGAALQTLSARTALRCGLRHHHLCRRLHPRGAEDPG